MDPIIGKAIATIGVWIGIGIAAWGNKRTVEGVAFFGMLATIAIWSDGCGF